MKQFFSLFIFAFLLSYASCFAQQQTVSVDTVFIQTMVDSCKMLVNHRDAKNALTVGQDALALIELSLPLAGKKTQRTLKTAKASLLRQFGNIYKDILINYPKALEYYQKCMNIAAETGDKVNLAGALLNTGGIYHDLNQDEKALDYMNRSLSIFNEIGHRFGLALAYSSLGISYSRLREDSLALEHYRQSAILFEEIGDNYRKAIQLKNIAQVYINRKKYSDALSYYESSLKIFQNEGDSLEMSAVLLGIGYVYFQNEGTRRKAESLFLQALGIAKRFNELELQRQLLDNLKELYQKQGKYQKAFEMYDQYVMIRDSLIRQQNAEAVRIREIQSDFEEKQSKLQAEKEKQAAVAEEKSRRQKITIWSAITGLILTIVFSLFILNRWRVTQKQKKIIEVQKIEVEKSKEVIAQKNKDITDSINYAKRIQRAMLPHRKDILAAFPQSFVLFKPKDIVSGDFYFFHAHPQPLPSGGENEKQQVLPNGEPAPMQSRDLGGASFFIAACDCTGHGVPGAFMSMIGADKLQDAVSQSTDPSEILSLLNKGIKASLKQSESDESTRDGMDIALVRITNLNEFTKVQNDTNNSNDSEFRRLEKDSLSVQLHYAGANRPLWIIRKTPASPLNPPPKAEEKGQGVVRGEVEEIKATKKAIGGLTEDSQHFDTHEIKLHPGDTFYISSDGYADQDGGDKGKKLMTKTFKQMLIDIQDKSMKEQKNYLEEFIDKWRGAKEQLDDILVIGVRI